MNAKTLSFIAIAIFFTPGCAKIGDTIGKIVTKIPKSPISKTVTTKTVTNSTSLIKPRTFPVISARISDIKYAAKNTIQNAQSQTVNLTVNISKLLSEPSMQQGIARSYALIIQKQLNRNNRELSEKRKALNYDNLTESQADQIKADCEKIITRNEKLELRIEALTKKYG